MQFKIKFLITISLLITTHSYAFVFDQDPILVKDKISYLRTTALINELLITTGNLAISEKNSNKNQNSDIRYKAETCKQIKITNYKNKFNVANEIFINQMDEKVEDLNSKNDEYIRILLTKLEGISCEEIINKDRINWKEANSTHK